MITVFYIGKNIRIFQLISQRFSYCDVIDAPSFVIKPYSGKTLTPPAIAVGLGVKFPKRINPPAVEKMAHPFAFFGQKATAVLISFGVMNIDFLMCNIVIAH